MFEIMARAPRVGVHCCQNRWTTGGDPHGFVLPCAGAAHGTRGGRGNGLGPSGATTGEERKGGG